MTDKVKKPEDTTTLLLWGIPKKLKQQFKARCAEENRSMKSVLEEFLHDFVKGGKRA